MVQRDPTQKNLRCPGAFDHLQLSALLFSDRRTLVVPTGSDRFRPVLTGSDRPLSNISLPFSPFLSSFETFGRFQFR
ncbi:hypothetical protein FQA47_013187 [Oryzias melastigma]|uniref:Uncharacterized protein n=1 Tax=Oryzias melastigma TaxID=30732 RepID=A0A834KUB9_ORYME|nr:hypothetical protein FQA47_013187 [Oryzias melastigma]